MREIVVATIMARVATGVSATAVAVIVKEEAKADEAAIAAIGIVANGSGNVIMMGQITVPVVSNPVIVSEAIVIIGNVIRKAASGALITVSEPLITASAVAIAGRTIGKQTAAAIAGVLT